MITIILFNVIDVRVCCGSDVIYERRPYQIIHRRHERRRNNVLNGQGVWGEGAVDDIIAAVGRPFQPCPDPSSNDSNNMGLSDFFLLIFYRHFFTADRGRGGRNENPGRISSAFRRPGHCSRGIRAHVVTRRSRGRSVIRVPSTKILYYLKTQKRMKIRDRKG